MSWFSALITLATGVVLPTVDVYSDLFLVVKMLTIKLPDHCKDEQATHEQLAAAMLTPPIISWLFVTYQWFKNEVGTKCKLMTLPFLLLQVYPQWKALKVLYYGKWKKQRGWQKVKEEWETGITHIGKY